MSGHKKKYFKKDANKGYISRCEMDLLAGKIRIYDVPFKYRTGEAYIYAARFARDATGQKYTYAEKKLLEFRLLSDIIRAEKEDKERALDLKHAYNYCFGPPLDIYNQDVKRLI